MTFFINQALMMFAGWDKISRETNTRIPEYFDGWGMDVKNAWNERTVDTIPYVSISLYPYIFISSTKTGSQYFLTSIYRLQDINSIFCRILFYFHGNHRFCIQRWIFWAKFWAKFFPHPPRCHQCYFSLFLQCLLFSVTRYVCLSTIIKKKCHTVSKFWWFSYRS